MRVLDELSCASTWTVKERGISKDGWLGAQSKFRLAASPQPNTLPAATLSTDSITAVITLVSAFNFDIDIICLFLSNDGSATFSSSSFGKRWTSFLQA